MRHLRSADKQGPVNRRFGRNLRRLRKGRGLSQEALADLSGIHRTEAGLLERAGREPRLSTLVKLAGALEVPSKTLRRGLSGDSLTKGVASEFRQGGKPRTRPGPRGHEEGGFSEGDPLSLAPVVFSTFVNDRPVDVWPSKLEIRTEKNPPLIPSNRGVHSRRSEADIAHFLISMNHFMSGVSPIVIEIVKGRH